MNHFGTLTPLEFFALNLAVLLAPRRRAHRGYGAAPLRTQHTRPRWAALLAASVTELDRRQHLRFVFRHNAPRKKCSQYGQRLIFHFLPVK